MIIAKAFRDEVGSTSPEQIDSLTLTISRESVPGFRKLLARALNTWDEAPKELKELADMIEHGKVLQEYQEDPPPMRR